MHGIRAGDEAVRPRGDSVPGEGQGPGALWCCVEDKNGLRIIRVGSGGDFLTIRHSIVICVQRKVGATELYDSARSKQVGLRGGSLVRGHIRVFEDIFAWRG